MTAMRIGLIGNPNWSHVKRWARALSQKGLSVFVFFDSVDGLPEDIHPEVVLVPLDLTRMRYKAPWHIKYTIAFRKASRNYPVDLFHLHSLDRVGLPILFDHQRPAVITIYGMDVTRYGDQKENSVLNYWIKSSLLKHAVRVTAASGYLRSRAVDYHRSAEKKSEVIPFGVDTEEFCPGDSSRREPVIRLIKDLYPEYELDVFIRSLPRIAQRHPEIRFEVIGDGHARDELRSLADQLGVERRLTFRPKVSHKELRESLRTATLTAMVSRFESFGVLALESQSVQTPVVGIHSGGLGEVLRDGIGGRLLDSRDPLDFAAAVNELLDDPEKIERCGREGRRFVKDHFEWDDNVSAMIRCYETCLERSANAKS